MLCVFNSELYKLRHRRGVKLCILIAILCGIALGFIAFTSLNMDKNMINDYIGEWVILQGENIYNFMFLFTIIIPALILTTEYSDNTMKNILFRGTSKVHVLLSKLILCGIMLLFVNICIVFSGTLVVGIRYGFDRVLTLESLKNMLSVVGKISLIMFAYQSIYFLISILTQNMILSVALCYGVRLVEAIIVIFAGSTSKAEEVRRLIFATYDFYLESNTTKIIRNEMLFCISIAVILYMVGLLIFKKKDIK